MSVLRALFGRNAAIGILIALSAGAGSARAEQDQFMVGLGRVGEIVSGDGSGFNHGTWYYYPRTDGLVQWFYNGAPSGNHKTIVSADLTILSRDPAAGTVGNVEVSLVWTAQAWPQDQDSPPLPDAKNPGQEQRDIQQRTIVQRTDVRQSLFTSTSFEIPDFCPQWVGIEVCGRSVSVQGVLRHDCVSKEGPVPSDGRDFGDAPEGALAYPSSGLLGMFPTCIGVGPAAWIEHASSKMYFGPKVDTERDGNAGLCPTFVPGVYHRDEGFNDGDAGLMKVRAYTIKGSVGSETVEPLVWSGLESLGDACARAVWGTNIDIEVHNAAADGRLAYVNVLMDWNHDGIWQGSAPCDEGAVPEHVLVDFPVKAGYNGPLSILNPPGFRIGPIPGYVWARFTITERPVMTGWNGDGIFKDGETEDYLLHVKGADLACGWNDGDPHVMHWAQLPDVRSTGIDVDMFWSPLADDFRCEQDGPVMGVHFWGSFEDDILPAAGPGSLMFEISIYANKPATSAAAWSRPGDLLWTRQVRPFGYSVREIPANAAEGWFEPTTQLYERANHKRVFQYDICLHPDGDLFIQRYGTAYWLEIKEIPGQDTGYQFGWKTTKRDLHFSGAAVWRHSKQGWLPMAYPRGHEYDNTPMDLAFVITGAATTDMDFGDAPDPTYPTLLARDGARHIISPGVYLGRGVDGETNGQPNPTATGDDLRGDDEDGVVFTTELIPGETATMIVTASVPGVLNAWIDWNADGDWDDAGEKVFTDRSLNAGANTLLFDVPVGAVSGERFARFRFSTIRGLRDNGLAPDGEVEDYLIEVADVFAPPRPPVDHLKWSQPPVEQDPASRTPRYCGWDEPAYVSRPLASSTGTWNLVADNFRCIGDMPVTSVHWWGSYQAWQGHEAPRIKPEAWRIGFWDHVPASSPTSFGRPGRLLWVVSVPAERIEETKAGVALFPRRPSDTAFEYFLKLQPHEYFRQSEFTEADTRDGIFWISITAVYTGSPGPQYPWGWKTRPRLWSDGAVRAEFKRDDLRAGFVLSSALPQPVADSLLCERLDKYDMAFQLDTAPEYVKWEQPFTGIRHWAHYEDEESLGTEGPGVAGKWTQLPDTTTAGVDVDITKDLPSTWPQTICADDFQCKESGPITGITLWASWYHDVLPSGSAENVTFTLSIRQDIPAERSPTGHSMPGKVLWRKQFARGEFTVDPVQGRAESYYSPANQAFEQNNHLKIYKYAFKIDPSEAFRQAGAAGSPVVYWLTAQAHMVHAPGSVATRLGWKTSTGHWNDAAVWVNAEEPYDGVWTRLQYPKGHSLSSKPIDLAFAIETERPGAGMTLQRIVADDWRCSNPQPVTGAVWWGSYIGYGYRPCECQQMPEPRRPDYFLLSIWTDAPDPDRGNPRDFSHPGRKIWEYKAESFDEVFVGFDRHPEPTSSVVQGFEPVYRYAVRLPEDKWFRQEGADSVCWFSVVAVYRDQKSIVYPWGWTNRPCESWGLQGPAMLAYWKLDEAAGRIAADSSGNRNDGTIFGNPLWRPADGWVRGALDLDGRRDYIKVEKPRGFDCAPNSFSVSAWIHPRETRGPWHAILEYDRDGINRNRFGLWLDPQGRFHFRVGQNTWHSQQSLAPNQWHHVSAVFDAAARRMKLYVNARLEGTANSPAGFATPCLATLVIGARGSADGEHFNGLIDDVRVFNAALTDEEVLTLVGAGRNDGAVAAQISPAGVAATWPWTQLLDQTGMPEDMSFMLFTQPLKVGEYADGEDSEGYVAVIPVGSAEKK